MSLKINPLVALIGAAIAFVICTGTGYWFLDVAVWPSVVVGLLFSITTFAAIMLAAALGKRGSSSFWAFWTPTRNAAYVIFVAAFQILVGVFCGFALERPASTVTLIAGAGGGAVLLVVSLIEYFRLRKREGPSPGSAEPR